MICQSASSRTWAKKSPPVERIKKYVLDLGLCGVGCHALGVDPSDGGGLGESLNRRRFFGVKGEIFRY